MKVELKVKGKFLGAEMEDVLKLLRIATVVLHNPLPNAQALNSLLLDEKEVDRLATVAANITTASVALEEAEELRDQPCLRRHDGQGWVCSRRPNCIFNDGLNTCRYPGNSLAPLDYAHYVARIREKVRTDNLIYMMTGEAGWTDNFEEADIFDEEAIKDGSPSEFVEWVLRAQVEDPNAPNDKTEGSHDAENAQ